ncbi:MAG: hypothetical protein IPJ00_19380 [Saprospirales bacterium]|nr:hypothetical protein [Saprospirales bacterium]
MGKEDLALLDSIHTRFQVKNIEIMPPDTLLVLKSVLPQPKTASIEKYVRSGDTLALAGSKILPNLLAHSLNFLTGAGDSYLIQSNLGGITYLSSYDLQFNETWIRNITEDSLSIFTLPISQQLGSPYLIAADSRRLLSFDLADGALRSQFLLPAHVTLRQGVMRDDTLLVCGYTKEDIPNTNLGYGVVGKAPLIDGIFQAPVLHTFGASDTFSSVHGIQVAGDKLICTGRTEAFFLPVSPIYQLDEGVASGDSRAWWFRVGGM